MEEDVDSDDRGHSASHPGYRRRQLRFLAWKLLSQMSSYVFFLAVAPVLRYGPNGNRFPLSSSPIKLTDTVMPELGVGFIPKPFQQPHPPIMMTAMSPFSDSMKTAGMRVPGCMR